MRLWSFATKVLSGAKLPFAFAVLLAAAASATAQSIPKFRKDAPYSQVRAMLLSQGFRIEPLPAAEFERCAPGRDDICKAYPETRICRGTGRASCEFVLLRKKGGPVSVETEGESSDPAVQRITVMSDSEISRMLAE